MKDHSPLAFEDLNTKCMDLPVAKGRGIDRPFAVVISDPPKADSLRLKSFFCGWSLVIAEVMYDGTGREAILKLRVMTRRHEGG